MARVLVALAALFAIAAVEEHAARSSTERPSWTRVAALGDERLAADLVLLDARDRSASGARVRNGELEALLALAPDWRAAWWTAYDVTLHGAGPVDDAHLAAADRVLARALERFPRDWEMALTLGVHLVAEREAASAEERGRHRRDGEAWLERAVHDGGGPPWLPNLVAGILTEDGRADDARAFLETELRANPDAAAREAIRHLLAARRRAK